MSSSDTVSSTSGTAPGSAPATTRAAASAGLAMAEALFNAHAVLSAVQHQLRAIEHEDAPKVPDQAHDAGRALRLAAREVYALAELLMDCQVTAVPGAQPTLAQLVARNVDLSSTEGGAA